MNVVGSGAQPGDKVALLYQTRAALRTLAGGRGNRLRNRFGVTLGDGLWLTSLLKRIIGVASESGGAEGRRISNGDWSNQAILFRLQTSDFRRNC